VPLVHYRRGQLEELGTFLIDSALVIDRIGIEGSAFLGRPLVLALAAAGYDTREVQANRTAERRGRRRRAKTDSEDAEAIARETLAHPDLPPAGKRATPHPDWEALAAIRNWRESLVLQRVRLLTEAEAVLVMLPVTVRAALPNTSRVLPQLNALANGSVELDGLSGADQIKLDRLAASLTDIATLTARIKELDKQIPPLLERLGCTLTAIHGIGVVNAMDLLTEIGDPCRFTSEGQFARWCGAAPIALSSGEGDGPPRRHRLRRRAGRPGGPPVAVGLPQSIAVLVREAGIRGPGSGGLHAGSSAKGSDSRPPGAARRGGGRPGLQRRLSHRPRARPRRGSGRRDRAGHWFGGRARRADQRVCH